MTFSLLTAAVLASGLLIGLVPTVVDGIKKPLQERLNLAAGRLDWFEIFFYITWLPAMPLAGWLLDCWPFTRQILFFSLVGVILGFTWMALAKSAGALYLSASFLGLVYSCLTTTTVRLMTSAFFPDDPRVAPPYAASLNLGFVAVGAGALVGPWLAAAIERWWGCRQGLLYVSVLCIVPAALTAFCESASFPQPGEAVSSVADVVTHPHLVLVGGVILLYFALENCLEFWPEAYLKELGYQPRGREAGMAIFWLAFIATRAAAACWFFQYPGHGLAATIGLLLCSAILFGILGNFTSRHEITGGSLGFWLVGACYGPLLPGFLAVALDRARPLPTALLGVLLALSGLDTLLVRPLMTRLGQDRAPRSVMVVPTVLAVVLAAPLLLLAFL